MAHMSTRVLMLVEDNAIADEATDSLLELSSVDGVLALFTLD